MIIKIAGLLLLVGLAAFYVVPLMRESRRRWPRVSATVRNHQLREHGGQGFLQYDVRYEWNGATHERMVECRDRRLGYRLYNPDSPGTDMRELLINRMRRAKTVKVEINPGNPSEAYLIDGEVAPAHVLMWVIGGVFFLFFVAFVYIAFV